MTCMNWYNENEPYAVAWLNNLMDAGHIGFGIIDASDIRKLDPRAAMGFTRAHFFAGIAGWEFALNLAGWPEDRPVWTGSCPCQPFSVAGKRQGDQDDRHLWPVWFEHIRVCRPPVLFGEQVASKDGREWLTGVRLDLESVDYAVGAADLCAASVGAPHIRQRLYWVAVASSPGGGRNSGAVLGAQTPSRREGVATGCLVDELIVDSANGGVANHQCERLERLPGPDARPECPTAERGRSGFWDDYELIPCADGKARRIEPGTFPLAHGIPNRVGKLRAYGNAIVPQVAAEFIQAFLEAEHDLHRSPSRLP